MELSCERCKEEGKAIDCKHMLHLVPSWQSSSKHIRLKTIMQDRYRYHPAATRPGPH